MTTENNSFLELIKIDVTDKLEKKGKFYYLSWAFAVGQLRCFYPKATWEVKRFDGLPFLKTELGYFVEVSVTVNDITLSQIHPVLNYQNKPILKPTSFDINTSLQRCLVKAIALHGLGLNVYAGEDFNDEKQEALDNEKEIQLKKHKLARELKQIAQSGDTVLLADRFNFMKKEERDLIGENLIPKVFDDYMEIAMNAKNEGANNE